MELYVYLGDREEKERGRKREMRECTNRRSRGNSEGKRKV